MKLKRFFIPSTLAFSAIAPVALVTSCSHSPKGNVNISDLKSFYNSPPGVVPLDISELSPDGLVDVLLNSLGVKMPNPAIVMAPKNKVDYDRFKSYVFASNFKNPVFRLKNGNEAYDLDFSEAGKWINVVKEILTKYRFDDQDMGDDNTKPDPKYLIKNHESKATTIGIGAKGYPIISFSKVALSMKDNMAMTSYLQIYDDDTLPAPTPVLNYKIGYDWETYAQPITKEQYDYLQTAKPTDPMWNVVDTSGIFDHNQSTLLSKVEIAYTNEDYIKNSAYLNLLRAYHKILWNLVNSSFYQRWVHEGAKTYSVAQNNSGFKEATSTYSERGTAKIAAPGEMYDQPNSLKLTETPKTFESETSNLEFVWTVKLLNIEGYIM